MHINQDLWGRLYLPLIISQTLYIGQRIRLEKVLLVGSKDFTLIGRPFLPRDQISVEATVVEKTLTHKKVNHWRNIKTTRQRKTQCKFHSLKKQYCQIDWL